ncbi:MAG: histidine kinase [Brevundimonas sp.]|uniref:histidine kinase n=1 Tax=Brevundimonas sp. TaxID=1871086 RepID=UPI00122B62FA|nr:sensor histidine kinase [Brevundimonas sp.]RZJ17217.1 MAG: histidine kinase [Brevundimonas sp.]
MASSPVDHVSGSALDVTRALISVAGDDDDASRSLLRAKVDLLRSQLDPDFLFNTLNSLSGLIIGGRASDADRLVGNLARYLRAPSGAEEPAVISLERETGLACALLEIEAIRMDRPDSVKVALEAGVEDRETPCLILLPLVEAAVMQGRDAAPALYETTLTAGAQGADTLVELELRFDRPATLGSPRFREAIRPLSQRLSMMYGSADRLEIVFGVDSVAARLRLPAE